jgi:regulator of replication initiation timing
MGLNEVFKKVADIEKNATELASEKIELATVFEDVSSSLSEMRNLNIKSEAFKKAVDDKKMEVKKAQNNFKAHLDLIDFQIKLATSSSDRLAMEASKLGLPTPDLAKNAPKIAKDFANIVKMDRKNYTV